MENKNRIFVDNQADNFIDVAISFMVYGTPKDYKIHENESEYTSQKSEKSSWGRKPGNKYVIQIRENISSSYLYLVTCPVNLIYKGKGILTDDNDVQYSHNSTLNAEEHFYRIFSITRITNNSGSPVQSRISTELVLDDDNEEGFHTIQDLTTKGFTRRGLNELTIDTSTGKKYYYQVNSGDSYVYNGNGQLVNEISKEEVVSYEKEKARYDYYKGLYKSF
jgi:hypothetical protein